MGYRRHFLILFIPTIRFAYTIPGSPAAAMLACGNYISDYFNFSGSFNACYMCETCNFRLDFDCAKLFPSLKLDCHHHILAYFSDFTGKYLKEQDDLSSSPRSMENKALSGIKMVQDEETSVIHTQIQHIHHNHQMYEVTEELNEEKLCSDFRLVLNGPTPSYFCKTCRDFYLHKTCTNLPYEIRQPFHFAHPLYLYTSYHPMTGQFLHVMSVGTSVMDSYTIVSSVISSLM
ncbi:hypothetical protein V6N13_088075 [Hibiscus sabdariffa]|uniref:DC1 domain-containing protein n=1 Tax=Hibiscus sabdariffa TaxID=183260 RepID=A0ABR2FZ46_9ROSI